MKNLLPLTTNILPMFMKLLALNDYEITNLKVHNFNDSDSEHDEPSNKHYKTIPINFNETDSEHNELSNKHYKKLAKTFSDTDDSDIIDSSDSNDSSKTDDSSDKQSSRKYKYKKKYKGVLTTHNSGNTLSNNDLNYRHGSESTTIESIEAQITTSTETTALRTVHSKKSIDNMAKPKTKLINKFLIVSNSKSSQKDLRTVYSGVNDIAPGKVTDNQSK
ncbi:11459_t:CDS:2 [Dentiscutata heterogama]|uniref:11459_t:CDS:1 n=1 Tax=Dentiscutata heterogama TaxID=1316150 RepID=A0ACA9M8Q6_9GLOM|nr:11459_t:CDS:2 [Dentiscutata heterogama]